MTVDPDQFKALAAQLRDLQDATKESLATFNEKVAGQGIDPAGLRRFVSWKRQDEQKRAQREAIDQQCRYLAGERDTPAELPIGCELARALNCFRRNMTVRQVAEELGVSTGKAGKLRELARMFDVHVHARVDKPRRQKLDVISPPETATLPTIPPHDPETGVIPPEPATRPIEQSAIDLMGWIGAGPDAVSIGIAEDGGSKTLVVYVIDEHAVWQREAPDEFDGYPVLVKSHGPVIAAGAPFSDTDESCGAAASASVTHNSHPVGHAEGAVAAPAVAPHDTPMPEGGQDEAPRTAPPASIRPPVEEDTLEILPFLKGPAKRGASA